MPTSFLSRIRTAVITTLLLSLVVPTAALRAATATPASYSVTRHQTSVPANHEFRFVTPSGVDAPTDTITLDYQGAFGLGAVTVGDVDLSHGPTTGLETSEALAGAPAAGVWGVTFGANTITFTAPSDAALGEIDPSDIVTIRIGTNAAGGVNQITNPSIAQVAQIILAGTFGDGATVGVPIITNDTVTVSATVVASSTPPGGGGGGPSDTTPPIITNVQVINITSSTASIIWNTNESSNSSVDYGITILYASGTVTNSSYVTSHQIDLSSLSPNTTYHFQVRSTDTAGNQATLGDFQFTTSGDVTAPIITNVQVVNITDTSARVTWQTNEPATSRVDYGTTTAYGLSLSDPGLVFFHSIDITGLSPLTLYNFFVTSADSSGNAATSSNGTFTTTGDATPPANPMNFTAIGGNAVVHLSWTLPPDPDLAGVRIVRRTDAFPTGPLDGSLVYVGLGTATDDLAVTNGTTYFYAIFAFDGNGNYSSGAIDSATPQAVIVPEDNAGVCGNGIDDDGDGNADCADSGCAPLPMCNLTQPENTSARCTNGIDDDGDSQVDCQDSECDALAVCHPNPPVPENTNARCSNGTDDDQDGAIDCVDSSCAGLQVCLPQQPPNVPQQPIPAEPEPTPSGQVITISPIFYGAGGTVQLVPDANREFGAPAGSAVLIVVPVTGLSALPDKAYATIAGASYNLTPSADGTSFQGTFVVPAPGVYPVSVSMTFQGGGAAVANFSLRSQSGGQVVEESPIGPTQTPVPGVQVTLFVDQNGSWVVWNGAPFNQPNPQVLGPDGTFVFVVPNGRYYVQVEKEGYLTAVTAPRFISKGVFGERVGLVKLPPALPENPTITDIVENIASRTAFGATVIGEFLREPAVQEAVQQTIVPALFGIALLNVASALPLFNLLTYLQYLFTQPLLLIGRRRKKKWGVVYNSLTKQPVELAIVRLLHHGSSLVVQTRVTDKFGRYSFLPKPGEYRLEVVKPGYAFPTSHLKGKPNDVDFSDLYHGVPIEVKKDFVVAMNIPVDPVVAEEAPRRVLFKKAFRSIQEDLALITVVTSAIALAIAPGVAIALITLGQVGMYVLFRRLSAPAPAKEWGIAFDPTTRKPLKDVVVRIFDKKFNKLLETQVTDANGRYGFFVRRNVYYVTAEKAGFEKYVSPDIDLSEKDEALVDQNLPLKVAQAPKK